MIWSHEGGSDSHPWELGQECDRIVVGRFSVSFTFQNAGPYTLAVRLINGRSGGLNSASTVSDIVAFSDE